MWTASFSSNIGTWMQNVVLPVYVLDRTNSASAVGIMVFAQLGPLLFLSIPAGVIVSGIGLIVFAVIGARSDTPVKRNGGGR